MKRFCKALFLSLLMLVGIHALADNVTEGNRLYRAKQYEEAMSFFMKLDAQKSPEIMNRIGFMYDAGRGVERNGNIAFQWYRKAAETGLAKAQ